MECTCGALRRATLNRLKNTCKHRLPGAHTHTRTHGPCLLCLSDRTLCFCTLDTCFWSRRNSPNLGDQMWNLAIKAPPVWSSYYLLKRLLKSPPWLSQRAFHNRGILWIVDLQLADGCWEAGQEPQLCAYALSLQKTKSRGFVRVQWERKQPNRNATRRASCSSHCDQNLCTRCSVLVSCLE